MVEAVVSSLVCSLGLSVVVVWDDETGDSVCCPELSSDCICDPTICE